MKKLVLFFTVVFLSAISANVFAQSTGTEPAPGATHSYYVTDNGNTLEWSVTKGDLTTSTTDATISSPNAATTNITWASTVTPGDFYYVHIIETAAGCSNEKVLPVQIAVNPFFLTLAAANGTDCYDGAVSVSLDLTDPADPQPNYDHGNTTIVFTVDPTGLSSSYTGYTFNLADLSVPAGYTVATPTFSANVIDYSSNVVTVDDNDLVTITYVVDNTNVYTNGSAIDAATYTATAVISAGQASNGVSDNTVDGTYTDGTTVSRPQTSGIGTN